jgi:hypothetical protein
MLFARLVSVAEEGAGARGGGAGGDWTLRAKELTVQSDQEWST